MGRAERGDRGREAPRAPTGPEPSSTPTPWRALRILSEFVEGFDALAAVGPAVTVFGSARTMPKDPLYETRADDRAGSWPRRATR